MTFQQRLILLVTGLVALAVVAITAALAWTTQGALLARIEADGRMAAGLLARAATQTRDLPREVEVLLGERLLSEATLTAHVVALAEQAKLAPKQISDRLKQIADSGGPDEMWITDNRGRAYLHNLAGPDPLFGQDSKGHPRHSAYNGLLNRTPVSLVSDAAVEGGKLMKFAGVAGVDKPRIVQVGAEVKRLGDIAKKAGPDGLIDALLASRAVEAAWLLDRDGRIVARGAVIGEAGGGPLSAAGTEAAKATAVAGGDVRVVQDGGSLLALAPIKAAGNGQGQPAVAVVRLPADEPGVMLRRELKIGGLLGVFVLGLGVYSSIRFARRQMAPVERLSEAVAAVEAGRFNPFTLNEATARDDEFGRLSRVFRSMALEASAREETLDAQLLMRSAELETKSEKLALAEQLIEEEQRAARDVQASLLPRQLPAGRDSQCFAALVPAHTVSGDFYDVIELDERTTLLVTVGVSGGGVPAAFLMLILRGAIREMARVGITPATLLAGVNERLGAESPFDGYATAFVGVYDRVTGALHHAVAGQPGGCRILADGSVEPLAEAGGPVLGTRKSVTFAEATVVLNQDDTLFLCTDGVLRTLDHQRIPFGAERFGAVLQQGRVLSARDRAELVLRAVEAHAGPEGLAGDLLCLVLRRLLPVAAEGDTL